MISFLKFIKSSPVTSSSTIHWSNLRTVSNGTATPSVALPVLLLANLTQLLYNSLLILAMELPESFCRASNNEGFSVKITVVFSSLHKYRNTLDDKSPLVKSIPEQKIILGPLICINSEGSRSKSTLLGLNGSWSSRKFSIFQALLNEDDIQSINPDA